MNTERKPTNQGVLEPRKRGLGLTCDELIEALELHLTPRTDPDHCDPCPYNEGEHETPQDTCQYRLMQDCLNALKRMKKNEDELYWVKDFISYAIGIEPPDVHIEIPSDSFTKEVAFFLGVAFEHYKRIWEK